MKIMLNRIIRRSLLLIALVAFALSVSSLLKTAHAAGDEAGEAAQYPMDWRVSGPTGGDVRALVVDPNDPQRFYFGTLDGQIYTSSDGGQQWSLFVNFNRPKLFIDNIIVDPRSSNTIYVGAHRHTEPGGFFKTSDGGRTWHESTELRAEAVHSLFQSDTNRDLLVAGTSSGVYRSENAGESWTHLPTSGMENLNVESLAIDPRNSSVIYAGTWHRPYKSTDSGETWRLIKEGLIDDSDVFAIDIDPRDPNHIIASACSGIYDSHNGGEQWRKVQGIPSQSRRTRAILQHPSVPGLVFAGTTEGFWRSVNGGTSWTLTTSKQLEVNSISVHPKNPDIIYIGTNNYGVMISRDGGKTFAPSNGGYSGRFVNFVMSDRERSGRIYTTTINTTTGGGFLFISNDGGATWQPSMRNMSNRLISYSILQDERDANTLYLGTNLGIYRSLDRGASWAAIGAPKIETPAPKGKKGRRAKASTASAASGASLRSNDMTKRGQEALNAAGYDVGAPDGKAGTGTVTQLRKFQADKGIPVSGRFDDATLNALGLGGGVQETNDRGKLPVPVVALTDMVNALAATHDERDGKIGMLAATNAGLYRTYDPTRGWEKLSYGAGLDPRTTCVSTSAQNPQTIWVGTATSGVLVSRDAGQTWEQAKGVPAASPISTIEQDPQRSAYIYVGTKQTLYLSHDGGERWMRRGGNLPYGDYASILINPENGNEIFVGNAWENGGGVYRSTNAGDTWLRIDPRDSRLPSQRIWALAFASHDQNRLFVGSHSAGVYVADRSGGTALNTEK
jgi:photosystem II stability/assembly factor-like uncharacterized protein